MIVKPAAKRRFWFDTEFIEDGRTIDLISIGIVRADGCEYYAESAECNLSRAGDWVKANVIPHLAYKAARKSREMIAWEIEKFVGADRKPEFWGYYCDYDWVALCQLFGTMMDLPEGWPKYCLDIKQQAYLLGDATLPEQGKGEHHALADARWNKLAWESLQ
jgi:hypothetical protein